MQLNKINQKDSGFSLIEVLVFVSILSLFFVAAATVVTVSLRNMKINEKKIVATRYAEDLSEWLRSERDVDWTQFVNNYADKTYCFNTDLPDWFSAMPPSACNYSFSANNFKRYATLTKISETQVDVLLHVEWQDSIGLGGTMQVPMATTFTIWD